MEAKALLAGTVGTPAAIVELRIAFCNKMMSGASPQWTDDCWSEEGHRRLLDQLSTLLRGKPHVRRPDLIEHRISELKRLISMVPGKTLPCPSNGQRPPQAESTSID